MDEGPRFVARLREGEKMRLLALSIPVSLFFMYQVRSNPKLGGAATQESRVTWSWPYESNCAVDSPRKLT